MKKTVALLLLLVSFISFAQTEGVVVDDLEGVNDEQPLTRKEKREIRRSIRKLQKRILSDEHLASKYLEVIRECDQDDLNCQRRLDELSQDTVRGTSLDQANGFTFGICKPVDENKRLHKVVYAYREYDCKLSSHGIVYNRKLIRRIYGPGLFWDKQSIVMVCTGPASGKKLAGWALSVGAGVGVTGTTVFGSIGACISVGAGTSAGALIGVDNYEFSE